MKRYALHISAALILIIILVGSFGSVAHAGSCLPIPGEWNTNDCVVSIFGSVIDLLLGAASWILAVAGYVLNFSMKLTLNIKTFVDNTPAIYLVWKSIRDISGMFIIFTLLIAAIKMILAPLDIPGPNVGSLIKTVVMAGILINFSFFIAGLGIDVSNVISAQLYKVIAPESNIGNTSGGALKIEPSTLRAGLDGGISDIFMSSLKIQSLYQNGLAKDPTTGEQNGAITTLKVIFTGIIGIVIMLTSAVSFFLAALAFIVRFVILIFLLGFSPIWLAAYAIPDLKKYADMWTDYYKSQLIFMPVYLLLLYFGLSVLTSANLLTAGSFQGASWQENLLVFGINSVFVIIMLNAPLAAALTLGAKMPKWAGNAGADVVWKKIGGWAKSGVTVPAGAVGNWAGRRFVSQPLASLDKKIGNNKYGNTILARDIRAATLGQAEKWKYGGSRTNKEYGELEKTVKAKDREIDRKSALISALDDAGRGQPPIIDPKTGKPMLDTIFKQMNEKEKLSMSVDDVLTKPEMIVRLKASDFEAIKKSEDISDEDKEKISNARENALKTSAGAGDADTVKQMLSNMNDDQRKSLAKVRSEALQKAVSSGNSDTIGHLIADMDGKELYMIEKNNPGTIDDPSIIKHLTPGQLKKLADEGLEDSTKKTIGNTIAGWAALNSGKAHRAAPFVNKNRNEWIT